MHCVSYSVAVGLGTTEFYDLNDGTVFLRTCELERSKLVVQIGTSDPTRALRVAKLLEPYVAAIDVNCGCPKEFSLKGGMGAALLTQPAKIRDILTTLVKGLKVPVTCKIRILPKIEDTLNLCRLIQRCGVAALAVHGRTKEERPQHRNHDNVIAEIASVLTIPVLANGGSKKINSFSDIHGFCERTATSSVMIARAVMWNCSILRRAGMLPLDEVIKQYLIYCIKYDNPFTYTKYTVQNMLRDLQESPRGKAFLETQSVREIASIWNLGTLYDSELAQQKKLRRESDQPQDILEQRKWAYQSRDEVDVKTIVDDDTGVVKEISMPMLFIRGNFCDADLPKMVLNRYVAEQNLDDPVFSVDSQDRYFIGCVSSNGITYKSSCIEKSRRYAEQAAAMVYLHAIKVVDHSYGFVASSGSRRYQHLSLIVEKTPRCDRQLQQAIKSHLGKKRRLQGKGDIDLNANSEATPENDLLKNNTNKHNSVHKRSSPDAICKCDKLKKKPDQQECDDRLTTCADRNKVLKRNVDEENLSIDTNAINLNPNGQPQN